jgi:hypothetical protein
MISSIFGKTKPINFVLLGIFLFLWTFWSFIKADEAPFLERLSLSPILIISLLVFSLFVIDFIAKRNQITQQHHYVILFFSVFVTMFPSILEDLSIVWANFFVLLGFRRLVSIKSLKNVKLKIFDATLWFIVASLFFEWAFLFIVLVFIVIGKFASKDFKNWIVPVIALLTVAVLFLAYAVWFYDIDLALSVFSFNVHIDFESLLTPSVLFPLIFLLLLTALSIVMYLLKKKIQSNIKQATMVVVIQFLIIAFIIIGLNISGRTSVMIFALFPIAIFSSNYVQKIKKKWFKEAFLVLVVLLPFLTLLV